MRSANLYDKKKPNSRGLYITGTIFFISFLALIIIFVSSLPDPDKNRYLILPFALIGVLSSFILLKLKTSEPDKYFICPNPDCDKSILATYEWVCDYCHNKQPLERHLTGACAHCGRNLKTYICPFCKEEFKL